MAIPMRLRFRSFASSASALKREGGGCVHGSLQGASRGIGLEFVKQPVEKNEKGLVIATCHNPTEAIGLLELKNQFAERLNILPLDVTIESTIEETAKSITERYGSLNLLINASGILSMPSVLQPGG